VKLKHFRKPCMTCGVEFKPRHALSKFCSFKCFSSSPLPKETIKIARRFIKRGVRKTPRVRRQPDGTRIAKILSLQMRVCVYCRRGFYRRGKRAHCSTECSKAARRERAYPAKACVVCGMIFVGKHQTCSEDCRGHFRSIRQSGAKSHRWRGGITAPNILFRNSKEYAAWRKAVFSRDDYTCLDCGRRGGKLDADHVKPFSTHPELRLDVSNGRTLCRACHLRTPTWGYNAIRSAQG